MNQDHDICTNCDQPIYRDRYPNGEVGVWTHAVTEELFCAPEPPRAKPAGKWTADGPVYDGKDG